MYKSCSERLSRSIGMDCVNPLIGGNKGRGVLANAGDILAIVQDATNPRIVREITLKEGAKTYALDNASITNPFDGSTTTGSNDSGYVQFVKVLAGRVLGRGADVSKDIVEPLAKSGEGYVAIIEKMDNVGLGSFEFLGLKSPLKCVNPSTVVRNENENGGAVSFQLQSTEPWFEVSFSPTPEDGETVYQAAKKAFDTLFEHSAE